MGEPRLGPTQMLVLRALAHSQPSGRTAGGSVSYEIARRIDPAVAPESSFQQDVTAALWSLRLAGLVDHWGWDGTPPLWLITDDGRKALEQPVSEEVTHG